MAARPEAHGHRSGGGGPLAAGSPPLADTPVVRLHDLRYFAAKVLSAEGYRRPKVAEKGAARLAATVIDVAPGGSAEGSEPGPRPGERHLLGAHPMGRAIKAPLVAGLWSS